MGWFGHPRGRRCGPPSHPHRRRGPKRWGLRRRLTFAFAFVALVAVSLTTWLTLGALFNAQRQLFTLSDSSERPLWSWGRDQPDWGTTNWNDPDVAPTFRQITRTAFLAAFLSFGLAVGAAAFVTRLLTRPLLALTDGARRLEAGERGLRLALPPARDELRVLTEAFNNLVAGLERQETWRRDVVADIAHDLRTPLAVMRSEIEAMQDGVVTFDEAGLARLHGEVMMLSRLVGDLRTLSLAEGGGLSLHLEPTPLAPLLQRILSSFAPRAAELGVKLTLLDVPEGLAARLDPERRRRRSWRRTR